MKQRWIDCGRSFRSLPVWVQVWVAGILIPVNAAPFLFPNSTVGRYGMVASLLILLSNVPIMLIERGMSRLMSVPHLLIWGLLLLLLVRYLRSGAAMTGAEQLLTLFLITVDGVSLMFDIFDSWRWFSGSRDVPGRSQLGQPI